MYTITAAKEKAIKEFNKLTAYYKEMMIKSEDEHRPDKVEYYKTLLAIYEMCEFAVQLSK